MMIYMNDASYRLDEARREVDRRVRPRRNRSPLLDRIRDRFVPDR